MTSLLGICQLWLLFFFYCVCGYAVECTYCRILDGHWTNRGFLNGPYLPIYGSGCIVGIVLFRDVTNPLVIFAVGGALCCALEWITSWTMEKLYHARWWDYSDKPLNFQGRFWIGGFVEFGIGLDLVVLVLNPPVQRVLQALDPTATTALAAVTALVMGTDLVITHRGVSQMRDKMDQLVAETRGKMLELRQEALDRALEQQARIEEAGERMQELRAHAQVRTREIREQLRLRENWERALDWQLGERLREAHAHAVAHRPDLPQAEALDEIAERFRNQLNNQERRMLRAFPELRPSNYRNLAQELSDSFQDEDER